MEIIAVKGHVCDNIANLIWEYINFSEELLQLQNLEDECCTTIDLTSYSICNKYNPDIFDVKNEEIFHESKINLSNIYVKRYDLKYSMWFQPYPMYCPCNVVYTCIKDKYSTVFRFESDYEWPYTDHNIVLLR